ncbi:MAG: hypothetical protein PSV16_05180 [Flavobacterium sp.]|nr:hypothetical protein [Flavobacterium sp.]
MCFSATASFGAGIVLTAIGVASIKKVQHRSQFLFAAIPLLFAIQQCSEGILWLTLPYPELQYLQKNTTFFFLIFAQIIWPLYVPIAILFLEKEKTRKNIQRVMVGVGVLVSGYLTYCLFTYEVHAEIDCYHIAYIQSYPEKFRIWGGLLYIIATIAPPFFSHIKRMWLLGITVFISYLITTLFYENYLVSVWCFFASVISISVWVIMCEIKTATRTAINKNLHHKNNLLKNKS